MGLSFFFSEEETGRLNNVFSTYSAPADFSGILASCNADSLAVDDEERFFHIVVNGAVELAVHGVIFEHVSHVVNGKKVVDSNYFDVITFCRSTEHETSDAAEAINTYFCHNCKKYWVLAIFTLVLSAYSFKRCKGNHFF